MSIRYLIWLSALSLVALVGLACFTGYQAVSESAERLGKINTPGAAVLAAQIEWQQQVILVQRLEGDGLDTDAALEQISLSRTREHAALEALKPGKQVAEDLSSQLGNWLASFHQDRDNLLADLQQNRIPNYAGFYQSANELLNVGSYLVALHNKNQTATKKVGHLLADAGTQLIFIFVLSLIVTAVLLLLFYNKFLIPLTTTNRKLRGLATQAGDLRLRLPEGDTELGQLGVSFNVFLQQVQTLVGQLQTNTQALMLASSQITDSVNKSASGTGSQIKAITRIANALQKLSDSLEGVGEFAGRASEASGSAIDSTESGNHIVVMAEQAIDQIVNEVEKATQVVMSLLDESQQVRLMQEQVYSIAEQTNQLALAAAIETTRARDPGRRLAPVVERMRVLALRAEETARSVNANVENLSQASTHAAEVMSAAQKRAGIIKNRIANASLALSDIVAAVDQIKTTSQDIARVSSDEKEEMAAINKNMLNVLQLARRNYTAGTAATKSREFLEQHLLKMNGLLQRFRT